MKKLRRTMLFVPGNNPAMLNDAHIYRPDSIILDLEDSVSPQEKDAARFLVFYALKTLDYGETETVVRVNGLRTPYGREDLEAIVRARPAAIRLPKVETEEDIISADLIIGEIEKKAGLESGSVKIIAAIESALGVMNAYRIAVASPRMSALALGGEDFITDLKAVRTREGKELFLARSMVLLAARAAKLDAIDTVFSNVADEEGFKQEVKYIKELGFDGKSVIHPGQISLVHEIFRPTDKEIAEAERIVAASRKAEAAGSGVVALDGKMIDAPVVERAHRVLSLAGAAGISGEKEDEPLA